jgi:hypothetical protein
MINWNDIKKLDLTKLDLTKLDVKKLDIRNIEFPNIEFPKVEFPKVDLQAMPAVDLPIDVERVVGFARDAAYVTVGAVVITAQKVDERRRELADQAAARVRKLVDTVA